MQFPSIKSLDIGKLNSKAKSLNNHENDLYYNDNYAIENFVQVFLEKDSTDPFKVLNDPLYAGFKIFFHYDAYDGLLADETNVNSALAYLKRIGQTARYDLLKRFINVLSRINSEAPWIFQSIEGIDEIYNQPFHEVDIDKFITISTLETIDCKISSLSQMYRHIAYDYDRKVEVLPVNLRRFSMSIYFYDFRNFDNTSSVAVDLLQTIKNQDIRDINHIMFDLGMCEFSTESGNAFFSNVSNAEHSVINNSLKIKVRKAVISSIFKSITGNLALSAESFTLVEVALTGQTNSFKPMKGIKGIIQNVSKDLSALVDIDMWKTKAKDIFEDGTRELLNRAQSALSARYMGNVYGFNINDAIKYSSNPDYRQQFNNIYSRVQGTKSLDNATKNTTASQMGKIK